jgi:copper chaperone CopZ
MKHIALLLTVFSVASFALAESYTLKVNGMRCQYCAKHLERELQAAGIDSVRFDLEESLVHVDVASEKELDQSKLKDTVVNAGFTLVGVEKSATSAQE